MPAITTLTTLSLPAGQAFVFEPSAGAGRAVADPNGRAASFALGGTRQSIGPWPVAVSVVVTVASGALYYEVDADGAATQPPVVIQAAAPIDADGRPDGTIVFYPAA
jgi:hypothetical protein